jgi:tRNA threonylcarbamoyladenosine modification (KEOPS) complex  Pcc1 subunit
LKLATYLSFEYDSAEEAEILSKALKVDDGWIKLKVLKNRIEAEVKSNSIPSLINTLDDFLACLSLAEKVIR